MGRVMDRHREMGRVMDRHTEMGRVIETQRDGQSDG